MIPFLPFLGTIFESPRAAFAPLIVMATVAGVALLPSLVAIALIERVRIRSRLLHVAIGAGRARPRLSVR
jgi:hypothetical protein